MALSNGSLACLNRIILIPFLLTVMIQCRTMQSDVDEKSSSLLNTNQSSQTLDSCVAIRGNGARIFAHFGALARYHEHYKPFQGLAGSSSGSITSFLYESMMKNPLLATCGSRPCTPLEQGYRLSFLLKSIFIYGEAFLDSEEIKALRYVFDQVGIIKNKTFDAPSFNKLILENHDKAWDLLQSVLSSSEIRPLVNREIFKLIRESANPRFHLEETQKALSSFGKFEAKDPSVLLFPGFIDWDVVAQRIGRMGDFYAGYGNYYPRELMEQVLNKCSTEMIGKPWDRMHEVRFSEAESCKQILINVIGAYRSRNVKDKVGPHRIDETPGGKQTILISTSVFTDTMAQKFQTIYEQYLKGQSSPWTPDYAGVKVGYFVAPEIAQKIQNDPVAFQGVRVGRFKALKPASWRIILQTSPAEPGLSGVKILSDGTLSAGGWIDLTPVLALKAVGCQNTLVLTRPINNAAGGFAPSMLRILGANEQQVADMIDANPKREPPSVFSQALGAADAILCADWDAPKQTDVKGISQTGYEAKFYSNSPYWRTVQNPHPLMVPSKGRESCLAL